VTGKPTPFDPDSWTRTEDTTYDEEKGELSWTHLHESHGDDNGASSAYFSYFPPYSYERHLRLVAKCAGKMHFFEISEFIVEYFLTSMYHIVSISIFFSPKLCNKSQFIITT